MKPENMKMFIVTVAEPHMGQEHIHSIYKVELHIANLFKLDGSEYGLW